MNTRITFGVLIAAAILLPILAAGLYFLPNRSEANLPTGADGVLAAAVKEFEGAIKLNPQNAEAYDYLSKAYSMAGRDADAETVWVRAAQANPNASWPYVKKGTVYESQGLSSKALEAYFQALKLNPQDSAASRNLARVAERMTQEQSIDGFLADGARATLEPTLQATAKTAFNYVNQPLPNGWTFIGYSTDLAALANGATVKLWSLWQAPSPDIKPSIEPESWYPVAPGLWGRVDSATNAFHNGGFENSPAPKELDEWPNDIYTASSATRQLRRIVRDGALTTAGALVNDAQDRYTSYVSPWRSLANNFAYIVSANVFNNNGNPAVGWRWSGAIDDSYLPLDRYAGSISTQDGWQHFTGLAAPPPGTTAVQTWLLNTATDGTAYFDDVVFAPVPVPAPIWPGGDNALELRRQKVADLITKYLSFPTIVQDPQWQSEIAKLGPNFRIGQPLASGWTLQGYSVDEPVLATGSPTLLMLFWQGPVGVTPGAPTDGWIDLQNGQWLQIIRNATNLIPQGSFEQGLDLWATDMFSSPVDARQLVTTTRVDITTTVGFLANTPAYSVTSFISPPFTVEPNTIFLQTGWLKGDSARAYIGVDWKGDIPPEYAPLDKYIAAAQAPLNWRRYAGVAEPPPGASAVEVWLLNYFAEGPSSFDNITLVPLRAPLPVVTDTLTATVQLTTTAVLTTAGEITQTAELNPIPASLSTAEPADELLFQYLDNPTLANHEKWLANIAAMGPTHVLDQPISEGWTFVGYTADETALAAGAFTGALYFWRGPEGVLPGNPAEGWYNLDAGYWVQIVPQTASLLPNGNLEAPLSDPTSVIFPYDITTGEPAQSLLQTVQRSGIDTKVVVLANAEITGTSGINSDSLPVNDQMLYLEVALMRSFEDGSGYLGANWTGENLAPDAETTAMAGSALKDSDWTIHAGILEPLPAATGMQVTIYNYLAPGQVEVDDVIVLPVLPPVPIARAVGAIPATPGLTIHLAAGSGKARS